MNGFSQQELLDRAARGLRNLSRQCATDCPSEHPYEKEEPEASQHGGSTIEAAGAVHALLLEAL